MVSFSLSIIGTAVLWLARLWLILVVVSVILAPAAIAYPFVGLEWAFLIVLATIGAAVYLGDLALRWLAKSLAEAIKADVERTAEELAEESNASE